MRSIAALLLALPTPYLVASGVKRGIVEMKSVRLNCLLLSVAALLAIVSQDSIAARCGGTERWFVKGGTDPDASLVRLDQIVPITVEGLNELPQLRDTVPHGDNKLRLAEERVVYQVSGRLVLFKDEDDGDYHLVVTDDSLKYTPGGTGTDGLETGTSLIVEIPDPACVAGKKGDPNVPSLFDAQLRDARNKFEARFPDGSGSDTDLGGIAVTVTGIAFYDRAHRQTGRAVNGIELHPLLDIRFDGPAIGVSSPPVGLAITQLLANTGFEDGITGWAGTVDDIGQFEGRRGHLSRSFAWMGGSGKAHTETLFQNVTIPVSAHNVMLALWLRILTDETTPTNANDKLHLQVRDKDGNVLKTLATFSNLDQVATWRQQSFDLSAFSGKDVQISFRMVEDKGKATSFHIDDITLSAQ